MDLQANLTSTQNLHIDRVSDFQIFRYGSPGGVLDGIPLDRNARNTTMRLDTPVQIFSFNWNNAFSTSPIDSTISCPEVVVDVNDTTKKELRVYKHLPHRGRLDSRLLALVFPGDGNCVTLDVDPEG